VHPITTSTRENAALRARLREETFKEWLNQPPIQLPLRPNSPIRNHCNNSSSSSQVDNGDNRIEVSMDDYLRDMTANRGWY